MTSMETEYFKGWMLFNLKIEDRLIGEIKKVGGLMYLLEPYIV